MSDTRQAAVAGMFYPAAADECRRQVIELLAEPQPSPLQRPLRALIVPHAGYVYSGSTAGKAYQLLHNERDRIRRVLLLGPNHTAPLRGIALPGDRFFSSPLGSVPLATDLIGRLSALPDVVISDRHHQREHCLEVQLPFLQHVLDDFDLLPCVVGDSRPEQVAAFLEHCGVDDTTLLLVSTDLSHFLPQRQAEAVDAETSRHIETLEPVLGPEQACGCHALNGLLYYARQHGLHMRRLARCTSADTAGDAARVVGYGSYALS